MNRLTPLPHITLNSPVSINNAVDTIYMAFNKACTDTMKCKGTAPGFCSGWWNDECREVSQEVQAATSVDERRLLNKTLKKVAKAAKCNWADQYITMANIWEVAA